MTQRASNKKVANSLVAVSSAAVLAVYSAGYARTRSAADEFEGQAADRRSSSPRQSRSAGARAELPATASAAGTDRAASPATGSTGQERNTQEASAVPAAASPSLAASAGTVATTPAPAENQTQSAPQLMAKLTEPSTPQPEHKVEVAAPAPVAVAAAPPPAPATPPNPALPPWKDGKYEGWGSCRHGDIQAAVTIQGGRITSAVITECQTRYSCDVIDKLIPQVALRQSPDVDTISGATQSGDAFSNAVFEALGKAK